MGIFSKDDGKGIERFFVELPEQAKGLLVYRWQDEQIRRSSRVTVDLDYVAVFVANGAVIGVLPPGRHELETGASPAFAWLIDRLTADRYYDVNLYWVATRTFTGVKFGGRVDQIQDPMTKLLVALAVYGDASYKVADPTTLITTMVGTANAAADDVVHDWISNQVLAAVREEFAKVVGDDGVLGLGKHQDATEVCVRTKANATLAPYGLELVDFGQLVISMPEDDFARVAKFVETQQYVELAGSYETYTRGEALRGMGSSDGGDNGGELLTGLLLAGAMGGNGLAGPGIVAPAQSPAVACVRCAASILAAAKFCSDCGAGQTCGECGERLAGKGRFCAGCGAVVGQD